MIRSLGSIPNDGKIDYKVFEQSGNAVRRFDAAWASMARQEPVKIGGEEANVLLPIFRARTDDAREAKMMVESGNAESFRLHSIERQTARSWKTYRITSPRSQRPETTWFKILSPTYSQKVDRGDLCERRAG